MYSGIFLSTLTNSTYSTNNIITGNNIWSDSAAKPKYGIAEADSNQDYNLITDNIAHDAVTAGIITLGANTHCDLCYNGTTWVP